MQQLVTIAHDIFGSATELLSCRRKLFHLGNVQRTNDIQAGLSVEFVKVHIGLD